MSPMADPQRCGDDQWLRAYFEQYQALLFQLDVCEQLRRLAGLLEGARATGRKVILAGNGGSAAIASHCAVDFTKAARVRSINFNEADLITCFANDYGYEHWLERAIEYYADPEDVAILISASGKSSNMLNAARAAADKGLTVVTLTGFAPDNPLRALGRLNLWVDSRAYNIVEMTHHIWLLAVCDLLAAAADRRATRARREAVPAAAGDPGP